MWPFKTEYERKKCDKCPEWASMFYGDAGQLCSFCYLYLDKQYKLMRVWLVLKRFELVGWVLLAVALWNYQELIDLYNHACMVTSNTFYSTIATVKSWMFFNK